MMTSAAYLRILLLSSVALVSSHVAARDESHPQQGDLVLFAFDNHWIPWRDNLKLTLVRPTKYQGNPILRPGAETAADGYGVLLYGTVLKIDGKFRMWYTAWPRSDSRLNEANDKYNRYRPTAYAESVDGILWERPNLGLVEFRGNKNNNLVQISPANEDYAVADDFPSVLYDPEDPDPTRRYKMAFTVWDKTNFITTATAVSADGLHWTLVNTSDITGGHFEQSALIKFDGMYYLSGQNVASNGGHRDDGKHVGRTMKVFFSSDFKTWSAERATSFMRNVHGGEPHSLGEEVHMGGGLWNRGNVVVGLYAQWHGSTFKKGSKVSVYEALKIDFGFFFSNDGIYYREPVPDYVYVPRGKEGEWDSEALLQANAFHNTDKETLIWYSHWTTSSPWPLPQLPTVVENKTIMGVGLLKLRRDGFGYLSRQPDRFPPEKGPRGKRGTTSLQTRPLQLQRPSRLRVNVEDVSAESPLKIELVDDNARALPGFSAVVTESSVATEVKWQRGVHVPANTRFRVRLIWPAQPADPKVYALYLTQD